MLAMIPRLRPTLGAREFLAALTPGGSDDVRRFEAAFAALMDQRHAIAFPHGRTGIVCLLEALGLRGREVVVPAWTCVVVPHAVVYSGNEPVFADSALPDGNMDLDQAGAAIGGQTGALVATSLFGQPVNLDRLDALRARHPSLPVIQDCAHSFACSWKGRPVHKEGVAAVFGLNVSKLMTSIFGGMITTDDADLAARLRCTRSRRLHGPSWLKNWRRRAYLLASSLALYPPVHGLVGRLERSGMLDRFVRYYDEGAIDMPADWLEMPCAAEARVGLAQVERYPAIIARRRANAATYHERLRNAPNLTLPPQREGATWSHFTLFAPNREDLLAYALQQGIQLGRLEEYNIPDMVAYRGRTGYRDCPVARDLARRSVNLPIWCSEREIKKISRILLEWCGRGV